MAEDAHSRNLRLHRLSDSPATFFVTKNLYPKKPLLTPKLRGIVTESFQFAVRKGRIYLRAFVVMPDHWHALFALREAWTLPRFMHAMMSFVSARTAGALSAANTGWQDGYYETLIKTSKQFEFVAYHIEQNPVKKGLVQNADEWDASSVRQKNLVTDPWPWMLDEE